MDGRSGWLHFYSFLTMSAQIQTSGPVLDRCHYCCVHEWQAGKAPRQCYTTSHGHGGTSWYEAHGTTYGRANGHATRWSDGDASGHAPSHGNASLWSPRHASWYGRTSGNGRTSRDGWTSRDGRTSGDAGLFQIPAKGSLKVYIEGYSHSSFLT